ncbi:MAG: thioredoxin domain-containing protein [Acidiferrobacterales bacterium]
MKTRAPCSVAILTFLLLLATTLIEHSRASEVSESQPAETRDVQGWEDPPAAASYSTKLRQRLQTALQAKEPDYKPRTEHLRPDGRPRFTNRLILEDSPYLLQHAHNPVNWFSWGPEAFDKAVREQKPIFLSIGYSTCYWCHVMERESFDNLDIARRLNEMFVSIKVDRERRPDIDEIYMTTVQMIAGRGGWPMSVFLTPEGKPFFGGSYFPPAQFTVLIQRVNEIWHGQRDKVLLSADQIAASVVEATAARGEARQLGGEVIAVSVKQILSQHDSLLGGFGVAPKFPREPELLLLLETALRSGREDTLAAVEISLEAMARGGIFDQVGGGFHRYSTDPQWLVPHFEKMLYNQAHLGRAYLEAHRLTGKPFYARVARQTLDYVLRDMTSPAGGFYSATDAESEGKEGEFFLWTPKELREALGDEADLAMQFYGVTEPGNFEDKNILNLPLSFEGFADQRKIPLATLVERVDGIREKLRVTRENREHPLRDDKIITAWNGMMITALVQGYEVLGERRYLEAAVRAADLLWTKNRHGKGELWRIHLAGSSSVQASQEDHAYLAEALIGLYDATGKQSWLDKAQEIVDGMLAQFWDNEHGGFFMTAEKADPLLIARPKSPYDSAIPSGNSVAVRALAMLAARTGELLYSDKASATLGAFSATIQRYPGGYAYMLMGADELLNGAVGSRRYAARGNVAVSARLKRVGNGAERLVVDVKIRDGWHINAHQPLQKELIPTVLTVDESDGLWQLEGVAYPQPEQVQLSFQQEPLAVYQGQVRLTAELRQNGQGKMGNAPVVSVKLKIQACNDQICLLPENLILQIPATDVVHHRSSAG